MKTTALFVIMMTAYIALFMAATNFGNEAKNNSMANDSISTIIYENPATDDVNVSVADENIGKTIDDQIANESISNRYLGTEETGFYVNDGSLDETPWWAWDVVRI